MSGVDRTGAEVCMKQGPRKTVLVREVGGEEASLRCLVS